MVGMKWSLPCLFLVFPLHAGEPPTPAQEMTLRARELVAVMDAGQKPRLVLEMKSDERENFRYTPRDRSGLRMKELNEKQRVAVKALLKTALSAEGLLKAGQIMELEALLATMEKRPEYRDPEKYHITIFGTPGDPKGWAWKFEGHHLSLNITVTDTPQAGSVSVTPSFFGANPAEVREGEHKGLRVLAKEEDLARELAGMLLRNGRKEVIFSDKPPAEILTGEERKVEELKPVGVSFALMNESERGSLFALIGAYLNRHRAELADSEMARIRAVAKEQAIHFGWAGGTEPGKAWYYRVQGSDFLMEAANSQNQANHIHTVWRNWDGDFGRDVLGEHYHGHKH